jgi:Flp pilus assembly protein CpaB
MEIAMNKPRLAALSVAALLAGISAALAGSATSRDNANPQAPKMQSDKTQSANVTAQSGDALTLSDTQRKMAWQDLYMDSLNQNTPPGFDAIVGAKVPNTIVIAPVTAQAGSDVPVLKPYSFAMVQKKLVIVNPSNRKIANVIAQ